MRIGLACLTVMSLAAFGASASANEVIPPLKANDTGGIIAWSPEAHRVRHALASEVCASFRKIHVITSVTPRYGDYIGFRCYWPRGTNGIVLRSAY